VLAWGGKMRQRRGRRGMNMTGTQVAGSMLGEGVGA
jgi:hypothetical protein